MLVTTLNIVFHTV